MRGSGAQDEARRKIEQVDGWARRRVEAPGDLYRPCILPSGIKQLRQRELLVRQGLPGVPRVTGAIGRNQSAQKLERSCRIAAGERGASLQAAGEQPLEAPSALLGQGHERIG